MSVDRLDLDGPTIRPLHSRQRIDWHFHTVHQLAYPIRGVLQVSTAGGTWVVPPNRAVWLPAGVAHAHEAHGPTEMRSLIFDPAAGGAPAFGAPTVVAVSPLLREVIRELSDEPAPQGAYGKNLVEVALWQLRRVRVLPLGLPAPADPRLAALTRLLLDDPADNRTLRALGREVGAAERTLSRLFREQTGVSFPQWRAQARLHHALKLLARGLAVTRVAADCGYRSPSAFVEAFRLAFGTTPGRYRQDAHGAATTDAG